ncbi:MAG: cofC [Betaproteobacteria bacterium]|nr:cofC [Betaproteobacteria bacterium]
MRDVAATPHIVLPVRGLADGKSRLCSVLDADEREALNRWLLGHTLQVLDEWRGNPATCVVVSACERVLEIARASGADALKEDAPAGLNAAAAIGAAHALKRGAESLLVVPCDLPQLTPRSLDALLDDAGNADVVIAPDKCGTGTNAILVRSNGLFHFRFGAGSFALHLEGAATRGARVTVHRSPAFAFDIDTAEDFACWRAACRAGVCDFPDGIVRTRSVLEE